MDTKVTSVIVEKGKRDLQTNEASIARCLYGGRIRPGNDEDTQVANALAWFALEEVAQAIADE